MFSHISSILDDKQYLFNKSGEYLVGKLSSPFLYPVTARFIEPLRIGLDKSSPYTFKWKSSCGFKMKIMDFCSGTHYYLTKYMYTSNFLFDSIFLIRRHNNHG